MNKRAKRAHVTMSEYSVGLFGQAAVSRRQRPHVHAGVCPRLALFADNTHPLLLFDLGEGLAISRSLRQVLRGWWRALVLGFLLVLGCLMSVARAGSRTPASH